MRALLALALFLALLAGAISFGSRLGTRAAVPNPSAFPVSTEERDPDTPSQPERRSPRKQKRGKTDPLGFRRVHVAADEAIARRAILHPDDVGLAWERVAATKRNPDACPENDPDLSGVTLTGEARTAFQRGSARSDVIVDVFRDPNDARLYFRGTNNRTVLRCVRDGIKGWLRSKGLKPRVAYARLEYQPAIGEQTMIYLVGYEITLSDGTRAGYPVELLTFQTGRAVGSLSYALVFSPDGSRPCQCEMQEANLVASRLHGI
jgi:hypothetical protein